MTRILTIAALLMVGAALAASPVLAADAVPGNKGPADRGFNRDAPLSLPGAVTPLPTPKVDPGATSRGIFDQDEAAGLDGLATLTLNSDGSVTETPASADLRDAFSEAVRGHRK
jgi:hypothetical protein